MIDAFDLYNDFVSRVNTFQGGSFSFNQDFVSNVNAIMFDIWERETKNARKSRESKDNVIAFHVSKNIIIPNSPFSRYSILPLPPDYGKFSSMRIVLSTTTITENNVVCTTIPDTSIDKGKCFDGKKLKVIPIAQTNTSTQISEISLEEINDDQWSGCLQHKTKYPKVSNPKMVQIDGSFQIAPKAISVVVFSYYKMPAPITVSVQYTSGDNQYGEGDEVIYTATPASQILFPLNLKNEFLWRLGTIYGYFTRSQFLAELANQKESK